MQKMENNGRIWIMELIMECVSADRKQMWAVDGKQGGGGGG